MTKKEQFEHLLQTHQIECNIQANVYESQRFQAVIRLLSEQNPPVLNQDTFDALCRIIKENPDQIDIKHVAQCFVSMAKLSLLTQENIQDLVKSIIHRSSFDNSQAGKLGHLFTSCPWLTQDDFKFVIQSKLNVDTLAIFMLALHEIGLNTPANCQALGDSEITALDLIYGINVRTQEELNKHFLDVCDQKLKAINDSLKTMATTATTIHHHALSLYIILCNIRKSMETQRDPRGFLHTITVIQNALPTKNNQPTKADIDELIAVAYVSEGHHSSLWKAVGIAMMLLGTAIAIAVGIATPVSMGIAAAGGSLSALTGVGFFAYGNTRTGLSKNIMNLAEAVQLQPLSL